MCVQKGEKEGRGWTHWLEGNKLHLVRMCGWSEKFRRERREGGGGDKEQGKLKHRTEEDGKIDLLSEGEHANKRVSESYLLAHSVTLSLCREVFEMKTMELS